MNYNRAFVAFLTFFAIVCAGKAQGDLKEVKDSVWVEDFEDGSLDDWDYDLDAPVEIAEMLDNAALHLPRAGDVVSSSRQFEGFSLEFDMQGAGGVRFGGKYVALLMTGGERMGHREARVRSKENPR